MKKQEREEEMHGKKASASECNMSLKLLPNISWLFTSDDSRREKEKREEDENTQSMVKKNPSYDFSTNTRHIERKKDEKKEASEQEEKDLWEFE